MEATGILGALGGIGEIARQTFGDDADGGSSGSRRGGVRVPNTRPPQPTTVVTTRPPEDFT